MPERTREQVTAAVQDYITAQMRTDSWGTLAWLNKPATSISFLEVPRDLPEPPFATEIRITTWQGKLEDRKNVLATANPSRNYQVSTDDKGPNATGQEALFELQDDSKKRIMWAGTTITLAQRPISQQGETTVIPTYPINYSEWIACYNPDYGQAFQQAGLPLPYAGLGVSVLMVTNDGAGKDDRTHGLIPLTRRGIETPVYPGRLYSPGGGPKPGQTSMGALLEEIVEETGLEKGKYFDADRMFMLAMVSDIRHGGTNHERPELVAYLPVDATFSVIERIQHETSVKKNKPQEDVWGVVPFSAFTPNLARAIVYNGPEMCPPTEAGLAHLLLFQETRRSGLAKALGLIEETMARIRSFKRAEYNPSIERLSR